MNAIQILDYLGEKYPNHINPRQLEIAKTFLRAVKLDDREPSGELVKKYLSAADKIVRAK